MIIGQNSIIFIKKEKKKGVGTIWGELNNRMYYFTLKKRDQLLENLQVEKHLYLFK